MTAHLHERKDIEPWIANGLLEPLHDGGFLVEVDCVEVDAVVRKLTFLRVQPAGVERVVWQREKADSGDDEGDDALEDEQPSPAR